MSLYAFGKVVGRSNADLIRSLKRVADTNVCGIAVSSVDREDLDVIESVDCLGTNGVTFNITSTPGDSDATRLWLDAMEKLAKYVAQGTPRSLLQDFVATRLGVVSTQIFELGEAVGVALVDGGIEEVFQGTTQECLSQMAEDVQKPWDQSANRLYVRKPL